MCNRQKVWGQQQAVLQKRGLSQASFVLGPGKQLHATGSLKELIMMILQVLLFENESYPDFTKIYRNETLYNDLFQQNVEFE